MRSSIKPNPFKIGDAVFHTGHGNDGSYLILEVIGLLDDYTFVGKVLKHHAYGANVKVGATYSMPNNCFALYVEPVDIEVELLTALNKLETRWQNLK